MGSRSRLLPHQMGLDWSLHADRVHASAVCHAAPHKTRPSHVRWLSIRLTEGELEVEAASAAQAYSSSTASHHAAVLPDPGAHCGECCMMNAAAYRKPSRLCIGGSPSQSTKAFCHWRAPNDWQLPALSCQVQIEDLGTAIVR